MFSVSLEGEDVWYLLDTPLPNYNEPLTSLCKFFGLSIDLVVPLALPECWVPKAASCGGFVFGQSLNRIVSSRDKRPQQQKPGADGTTNGGLKACPLELPESRST